MNVKKAILKLTDNKKDIFVFFLLTLLMAVLLFGKGYSYAVKDGITMFFISVFPSVFPYFFITSILTELKSTDKLSKKFSPIFLKVFRVNGSVSTAFFLSVVSGYPVGAKLVSKYYEKGLISKEQVLTSSILCSNPSPMFIIGTLGRIMFNSPVLGVYVFFVNLISSVITALIISRFNKKTIAQDPCKKVPFTKTDLFSFGINSAVNTSLMVGGVITMFYLLTEILHSVGILSPLVSFFGNIFGDNLGKGVALGIFETTRGFKELASVSPSFFLFPILSALSGFGGISVIAQSVAFLKKTKIKTAQFVFLKLFCAVINFIFALPLCFFIFL